VKVRIHDDSGKGLRFELTAEDYGEMLFLNAFEREQLPMVEWKRDGTHKITFGGDTKSRLP
jgi:hypothetical protein